MPYSKAPKETAVLMYFKDLLFYSSIDALSDIVNNLLSRHGSGI